VILSQVVQRCPLDPNTHDKTTCTKGYHGAFKDMEKYAVQEAFQWLQEQNINITTMIYDKDSSTYSIAASAYPSITEWLCINHAKGNFYKDLTQFIKKFKYLEPWISKATSHFSNCLQSADGDIDILQSNWKNMLKHMQNKHDLCNENICPYKRDPNHTSHYDNRPAWLSVKEHTPGIQVMRDLIDKYYKNVGKYVYRLTSNVIKSINNVRTKYAFKAHYHDKSYPDKNVETIAQYDNPHIWKQNVMEEMNISVHDQVKDKLQHMANMSIAYSEKTKTKEYKLNKIKNKKVKKVRGASSQRNKHRYDCSCKVSKCVNGMCQCIKDDRPCGDNCMCKHTDLCLNNRDVGMQNREAFKNWCEKKGNSTLKKRQQDTVLTEGESSENSSKKRKIIMLKSESESE
jgi:hypothetical protein